ncbi:MAG: C-terminal binding protein [Actinobacteria bacterium]|nr:C-terminal binding protein [Actinomycetota bacterium]
MSARPLVLAIGPTSAPGQRILREALRGVADVAFRPDADAALDLAGAATVAIVGGPPLPERFLARAERLARVYRVGGASAARGEAAALRARGVAVSGPPPGLSAAATAEHALALLLALTKRLVAADAHVRAGDWRVPSAFDDTARELGALTVGIVGLGRTGARLARLLEPFGTRIVYTRRSGEAAAGVPGERVALGELLGAADAVSLHVRAAPGAFLLGARELDAMRPGAWLVNTARAHLLDHEALLRALDERLAGAALDVFPDEPRVDPRLRAHPRVLLTPHAAGRTAEAAARYYGAAARAALETLERVAVVGA